MDSYELAVKKLIADQRSINELERVIKLPAETLRNIKRGIVKSPRLDTLRRIAKHYARETA